MQKKLIYGIAILYSFLNYFFYVMPLDVVNPNIQMKLIVLSAISIFPLLLAWILINKGLTAFVLSLVFHFIGIFSLYGGFPLKNQISVFNYSIIESKGSFLGIESFILYILFSTLGLILSVILLSPPKQKNQSNV